MKTNERIIDFFLVMELYDFMLCSIFDHTLTCLGFVVAFFLLCRWCS